jgi:hypothetical protein
VTLVAIKRKIVYAKNSDLNDLSLINLDVDHDMKKFWFPWQRTSTQQVIKKKNTQSTGPPMSVCVSASTALVLTLPSL